MLELEAVEIRALFPGAHEWETIGVVPCPGIMFRKLSQPPYGVDEGVELYEIHFPGINLSCFVQEEALSELGIRIRRKSDAVQQAQALVIEASRQPRSSERALARP